MNHLPHELERCRRYAYPLSVIMCDIDHFKRINDEQGHAAGDDVLQQFALRIQKSIRGHSDWIARYGGEEFLLVLPETEFTGGVLVAGKVRNILKAMPFTTRAGDIQVTASFGGAATGSGGPDLDLQVEGPLKVASQC